MLDVNNTFVFFFCQFIFWSVVNVCFWQVRAKEQENLELQSEMADARKKHEVCNGLFIHILRPPYVCMCSRNVILFDNYYATIYPPQKNSYLREIWGRLIIIFLIAHAFDKLPNIKIDIVFIAK